MVDSHKNDPMHDTHAGSHFLDSRLNQLDDVLNEKLQQAFYQPASPFLPHDVAKISSEYDPIDLAYAVTKLPLSSRFIVYENLPDIDAKIIFIINTNSSTRATIFSEISDEELNSLLEKMPPDEAAWLLDDMSDRRMKRVLDSIEPKKAVRIRELYKHDRESAGRMMTNEFFAFAMNANVGDVAAAVRNNPGIDLTRRIFVLNDKEELIGFVPERNLIVNASNMPIRQIMRPVLHQITPDTSRDEVVDLVERYKISALPVVDQDNRLLGVITYERVVEAMEDLADETIASIAGTAEEVGENSSIFNRFFSRAPWLIVTLCAGLVSASALSYFKDKAWFAVVALFVPLITGMSGNVGIQCSTILVRGISTGEISQGSRRKAVFSELSIGLLISIVFGLACGILVFLLNPFDFHITQANPIAIGAILSFGLLGACFTATMLGTLSPFVFARLRIDPAVASGPIVTAFNDVLSTIMYIFIARLLTAFFL